MQRKDCGWYSRDRGDSNPGRDRERSRVRWKAGQKCWERKCEELSCRSDFDKFFLREYKMRDPSEEIKITEESQLGLVPVVGDEARSPIEDFHSKR